MAKAKEVQTIVIPPLKLKRIELDIIGDTPLLCHAWSGKAKKEMLDKQMKKAKQGKDPKDPVADYRSSLYWLDDANEFIEPKNVDPAKHQLFGFKTIAFKAAAVRAANDVGLQMTFTRRAFHVLGDYVKLEFDKVIMREDPVRLNGTSTDLRYRGEFHGWKATLPIKYNASIIEPAQLVNLLNTSGFGVGIGEWRPERNGSHGCFHVG